MNSGLLVYLFSVLLMVLIYQSIMVIRRIRPNSYLGEFLQSRSGRVLAALFSFIIFCIAGLVYLFYFSGIHC